MEVQTTETRRIRTWVEGRDSKAPNPFLWWESSMQKKRLKNVKKKENTFRTKTQ